MSRSKLRNKWMRKLYAKPCWSYMRRNMQDSDRNPHRQDEMPKNYPSKFITTRCGDQKVRWLQESTSFGGHSIPKGGHRRVSGIVRAKVKEEVRKEIENSDPKEWMTVEEARKQLHEFVDNPEDLNNLYTK